MHIKHKEKYINKLIDSFIHLLKLFNWFLILLLLAYFIMLIKYSIFNLNINININNLINLFIYHLLQYSISMNSSIYLLYPIYLMDHYMATIIYLILILLYLPLYYLSKTSISTLSSYIESFFAQSLSL
jgi:hypothetical protein